MHIDMYQVLAESRTPNYCSHSFNPILQSAKLHVSRTVLTVKYVKYVTSMLIMLSMLPVPSIPANLVHYAVQFADF